MVKGSSYQANENVVQQLFEPGRELELDGA